MKNNFYFHLFFKRYIYDLLKDYVRQKGLKSIVGGIFISSFNDTKKYVQYIIYFLKDIKLFYCNPKKYFKIISSEDFIKNVLRLIIYIAIHLVIYNLIVYSKFELSLNWFSLSGMVIRRFLHAFIFIIMFLIVYFKKEINNKVKIIINYVIIQDSITLLIPGVLKSLFYVSEIYLLYFTAIITYIIAVVFFLVYFPLIYNKNIKKIMYIIFNILLFVIIVIVSSYGINITSFSKNPWSNILYDPIGHEAIYSVGKVHDEIMRINEKINNFNEMFNELVEIEIKKVKLREIDSFLSNWTMHYSETMSSLEELNLKIEEHVENSYFNTTKRLLYYQLNIKELQKKNLNKMNELVENNKNYLNNYREINKEFIQLNKEKNFENILNVFKDKDVVNIKQLSNIKINMLKEIEQKDMIDMVKLIEIIQTKNKLIKDSTENLKIHASLLEEINNYLRKIIKFLSFINKINNIIYFY